MRDGLARGSRVVLFRVHAGGGIDFLAVGSCGAYLALEANGTDGGNTYYYDRTTGKLVAVVSHDYVSGAADCRGGPSDFVEPSCSLQQMLCGDGGSTLDGGNTADATSGGSGGADAGGSAGAAGAGGADAGT